MRFFPPEPLFYLHYSGLIFGYFAYRFSQYFHRPTSRINILSGTLFGITGVIFSNTFRENKRLVSTLGSLNKHLEDLNTHLEEMVADRTRDLDVANKDLSTSFEQLRMAKDELVRSEKLAALGALVAGIAHELNTPIGNGLMAISTLRDELHSFRKDMAAKGLQRKMFDNFLVTIDTATDITNRSLSRSAELVRSFKQLSIDQATDARRRFSVREQVAGILLMLKPTLTRTPYRVETFIAADMTMDSYPGALLEIVSNLVNNALVHGFDGRDHGLISIQIEPAAPGFLVMRFADDGKGIPEGVMPRIFDPFFTTKMGQGGSGREIAGVCEFRGIRAAKLGPMGLKCRCIACWVPDGRTACALWSCLQPTVGFAQPRPQPNGYATPNLR